ncbi:MAG: hypothetical protein AAF125_06325 [Chloroflexota bacterium]
MDSAVATNGDVTLQDLPEPHDANSQNDEQNSLKNNKNHEKRFTLRLSPEAVETLDWISSRRSNASYQEVIRRALGTERLLLKLVEDGYSIIVEKEGARSKEIVFR